MSRKPENGSSPPAGGLDQEQRARLLRLFEEYKPGERVRAVCTIVDAASGLEIQKGTVGVVQEAGVGGCAPLFAVEWSHAFGQHAITAKHGSHVMTTSAEHLEPVDRPLRGGQRENKAIAPISPDGLAQTSCPRCGARPHRPDPALPVVACLACGWQAPAGRLENGHPAMAVRVVGLPAEASTSPAPPAPAAAFLELCRFDLPDIREQLVAVERAWRECLDDLEAVGVLRTGHNPPDGVANMHARMPGLRACIHLLGVLISRLPERSP